MDVRIDAAFRSTATLWLSRAACLVLLCLLSVGAMAQSPRAWLDRDRIALGETVTLNIEVAGDAPPEYSLLEREFDLSGHSSRREFQLVNGRASTRSLYGVALRPRREGQHLLPALQVGAQRTPPLQLLVTPADAGVAVRGNDDVFIEAEADDQDPYLQQTVGWVVRLYSAVPLVSGELEQPAPAGASLQRMGDDAQYTRTLNGRTYTVIERRFLLVPERSGELTLPGAQFEGRGQGGFFEDMFGDRGGALKARAAPRIIRVRPMPANAPQPWLPLKSLQLRYTSTPRELKVGSAATLVLTARADGAIGAQMPELQLPPTDGLQVFAEPPQFDEVFQDGGPRVVVTRRFSLVPSRAGPISLPGPRLDWWDVRAGVGRQATLPALNWQVSGTPAVNGAPVASGAGLGANQTAAAGTAGSVNRLWIVLACVFAALWLLTLLWALQRRAATGIASISPGTAIAPPPLPVGDIKGLTRALDAGDFADVERALLALTSPPAADLDALSARLDSPEQREALAAMQRARWAGGDGPAARIALRAAFAPGPQWRATAATADEVLPPLYPRS